MQAKVYIVVREVGFDARNIAIKIWTRRSQLQKLGRTFKTKPSSCLGRMVFLTYSATTLDMYLHRVPNTTLPITPSTSDERHEDICSHAPTPPNSTLSQAVEGLVAKFRFCSNTG